MATNSAGTLVGAVLETVGYHYQAYVLDDMAELFSIQLGGLIYLVGILLAVFYTATRGRYNLGVWLLLGPPLFLATVQVRDEIPNARWMFGSFERPNKRVVEGVKEVLKDGEGAEASVPEQDDPDEAGVEETVPQARVSKLFKKYVGMISAVDRKIVDTISQGRTKTDLWFLMKAELFGQMHTTRVQNLGLRRLIQYSLLGECAEVIRRAEQVNDPLIREFEGEDDPALQEALEKVPEKEREQAKLYLRPTQARAREIYEKEYNTAKRNVDEETAEYMALLELERNGYAIPEPDSDNSSMAYTFNYIKMEIATTQISCREIWGYALYGILKESRIKKEKVKRQGKEYLVDEHAIENLIAQVHGFPGELLVHSTSNPLTAVETEEVTRIIAKFFLRNEAFNRSKPAWLARFVSRHDYRTLKTRNQGYNSYTEQARLGAGEWAERERLLHAAASLPYYQGLLLYFLSIGFPFFALLLLVPGKQGGFLLWFTLWFWVKSWDIGMAIVMFLDDCLFSMFAVANQELPQDKKIDPDFALAMVSLKALDPTFQMATYYAVIAVCILAVPPTMAQLILGSMRGGATLVSAGMSNYAKHFRDAFLMQTQQVAITNLKLDARANKLRRAHQYFKAADQAHSPYRKFQDGKWVEIDPQEHSPVSGGGFGRTVSSRGYSAWTSQLKQDAYRTGFGAGLSNPRKFNYGTSPMQGVFRLWSASFGERVKAGFRYKQRLGVLAKEKQALAMHALWDADIDQEAIELYERIATYGGIPIPWSNFVEESSIGEFNLALQRYQYEQEELATNYEVAAEVVKGIVEIWRDVSGNKAANVNQVREQLNRQSTPAAIRRKFRTRLIAWLARKAGGVGAVTAAGAADGHIIPGSDTSMIAKWQEGVDTGINALLKHYRKEPRMQQVTSIDVGVLEGGLGQSELKYSQGTANQQTDAVFDGVRDVTPPD